MRLRTKYFLFVGLIHAVALVMSYMIFSNSVIFLVCEALILVSIGISWNLYRQLIQPLQTLLRGADAIRDQDFNVKFLTTGKYELDQLISVYNDMMDHLREERTRQEEQHFFLEKLIQGSPTAIVMLDLDEKIYQVNPRALVVLGAPEGVLIGLTLTEAAAFCEKEVLLREMAVLESGRSMLAGVNGVETYKLQKSHFIDRGFVRHFIMIEEVTSEILAAEKRAYGKVIRMMAHEVNNTIGPVNSILESTLGQYGAGMSEGMNGALHVAIQRNTNLNHFMRNFADVVRLPAPEKRPVDMLAVLDGVVALMRMQMGGSGVEIVWEKPLLPLLVLADAQQLEQVLINIMKNAAEAMEGAGVIEVVASAGAGSGRVVVRDNGVGIPAEMEEKLFSPFFSTKSHGQGIGLTLIREILINHGFLFSLQTVAPGITEFEITF